MLFAGSTWFLGTVFEPALFLHRGPLVHLHLSYPTGRLRSRLSRRVVAAAYVDAGIEPLAHNDVLTLALSAAVAVTAVQVFTGTSGPARKAGGPALASALAFAGVLAASEFGRAVGRDDTAILWLRRADRLGRDGLDRRPAAGSMGRRCRHGPRARPRRRARRGTLRSRLARALGDPPSWSATAAGRELSSTTEGRRSTSRPRDRGGGDAARRRRRAAGGARSRRRASRRPPAGRVCRCRGAGRGGERALQAEARSRAAAFGRRAAASLRPPTRRDAGSRRSSGAARHDGSRRSPITRRGPSPRGRGRGRLDRALEPSSATRGAS